MGAGDAEIAFLIGYFLGFPNVLPAFYVAFIIGSIYGLVKIYLLKNAKMKSEIPFGPFLILGVLISYFFGPTLVNFYVRIILGS
jgi:prepilin signal peptidase PulO-like enzyme (type II secretory pathway)